jgi:LCP family protein required for cell wall assembly
MSDSPPAGGAGEPVPPGQHGAGGTGDPAPPGQPGAGGAADPAPAGQQDAGTAADSMAPGEPGAGTAAGPALPAPRGAGRGPARPAPWQGTGDLGLPQRRRPFGPSQPSHLFRRIFGWAVVILVLVVAAGALSGYLKYRSVWNSIHRITVTGLGKRPPQYNGALNILLFGSDSRAGLSRRQQLAWHVGLSQGETNTDTIMVVHISPGRHQVTVLSIPRDTMVPYYACPAGQGWPGQQASPGSYERINAVMAAGGPSCLWKTVEQQTGIHLDHFIELSFSGFVHVINDIGGVNVCVPFTVNNPVSGLQLTAGMHHINGVTALSFWRTREDIGMGSDLQRIQRDQFLMSQVVKGVLHSGVLSNPVRLVTVVSDAARAMTTDSGLGQSAMLQLAVSLHSVASKDVQFVTAPNVAYPPDPGAEVEFAQPQASRVFAAIAHDLVQPLVVRAAAPARSTAPPAVRPRRVHVTVLNGAGVAGRAGQVAAALSRRGFRIISTGDAASFGYANSVIQYRSAAQLPEVKLLSSQLAGARIERMHGLPRGSLNLIVGANFTALTPWSPPHHASSGSPVTRLARNYGGISASASCHSDSSAFAGPLSP